MCDVCVCVVSVCVFVLRISDVCHCRSLPQHAGDQHSSEKLWLLLQWQQRHADHRQDHGLSLRDPCVRHPRQQPDQSVLLLFFNCVIDFCLGQWMACFLANFPFCSKTWCSGTSSTISGWSIVWRVWFLYKWDCRLQWFFPHWFTKTCLALQGFAPWFLDPYLLGFKLFFLKSVPPKKT